jgi:hypothetical protein
MSVFASSGKFSITSPIPAVTIYLGLVVVLLFAVASSVADVVSQRDDVAASSAMLEQLEATRLPRYAASLATRRRRRVRRSCKARR